jgi:periplasmic protein TonB
MISPTLILEQEKEETFARRTVKLSFVLAIHATLLAWVMHAPAPPVSRPAAPLRLDVRTIEIPPPASPQTSKPVAEPQKSLPQTAKPVAHRPQPVAPPPVLAAAPSNEPAPATFTVPPAPPTVVEPSAPPAPAPTPMTPARFDADYLQNPAPAYPALSRKLHEEGKVLLQVKVTAAGMAEHVQIKQGSGYPRLDEAALNTVRQWRFVPARRGDEAIAASVVVPIVFRLDG